MKVLSIDTETTGLNPENSELLEVAIVGFDTEQEYVPNATNSLRIVFIKNKIQGELYAINLNAAIIKEQLSMVSEFKKQGKNVIRVEKEDHIVLYVNADKLHTGASGLPYVPYAILELYKNLGIEEGEKLNIAGKNFAGFDSKFLAKYECLTTHILKRARHRILDVGPMYVTKEDECVPNLKTCLERAGIVKEIAHTAVEDARDVIVAIQHKLK